MAENMTPALLSCPFCGVARCSGATGNHADDCYFTLHDAVISALQYGPADHLIPKLLTAWNTRPATPVPPVGAEIDLPAVGAQALTAYLEECERCAIEPDIGGAFAYATRACANAVRSLAATPAAPAAEINPADFITEIIPGDAQKTIGFIHKIHSGVRLTHKPTGTTAESTTERSSHANRAIAWDLMMAKLTKMKEQPAAVAVGEREAFEDEFQTVVDNLSFEKKWRDLDALRFCKELVYKFWATSAALATTPANPCDTPSYCNSVQRCTAMDERRANPWQQAVDAELVSAHLGIAGNVSFADAAKALSELIQWNIDVATNPQTNGGLSLQPAKAEVQAEPVAGAPFQYYWQQYMELESGPGWADMYRDYDPRLPENRKYHHCNFDDPAEVRNFHALYTSPQATQQDEVTDAMVHAALKVQHPTLFMVHLRHPANGPQMAKQTEKQIQVARAMITAAIQAAQQGGQG